ncbi:MAG: hypothetical protein KF893_24375 [Caldilineaceae bacterium]|nr:hypothetical protein [Caldilineaceae bacterium]
MRFQVRGADRLLWLTDNALWVTLLVSGTQPDAEMEHPIPHVFSADEAAPASRQGVHLELSLPGVSRAQVNNRDASLGKFPGWRLYV